MGLGSTHPQYDSHVDDWKEMRDLYQGERYVKSKGEQYLPATKSMKLDGMGSVGGVKQLGQEVYDAYRVRALLPDFVEMAVESYIGMLHMKPPTIELPAAMEPLREMATLFGEPLELLLRRINEEQLLTGRLGLLLDLPKNPDPAAPKLYIALYVAEAGRNWDDGAIEEDQDPDLNLVVLDESGYRREEFDWIKVTKYRVLDLFADGEASDPVYRAGVFKVDGGGEPTYVESDMETPMLRGQTLDEIPFVFVNTKDITSSPDKPPLLSLARLALAIYRGEADYRQNLFMQGQDTMVIMGDRKKSGGSINTTDSINELAGDEPLRTGSGSLIEVELGGDVKMVGVESQGLAEQRASLENDRRRADAKSGQLAAESGSTEESGKAKQTRIAAQTATLKQIALTGAASLEWLLRIGARWIGANPEEVKVTPNLEFGKVVLEPEDLVAAMTARSMGAPLSLESIHALQVEQGLTKFDYETEKRMVDEERASEVPPPTGTGVGGNPAPPSPAPPAA
jgi:uncharacterized protein DUF4055